MMKWLVMCMKNLELLLNKAYNKRISEKKAYRKQIREMDALLKEYQIVSHGKEDLDFFAKEVLWHSLLWKRKLEDVFFDTYVAMYDYWYDLTYLQRKQQMNMEIGKLLKDAPYFIEDDKKILMPCFDPRFNHLYTEEIVLLDLKQYHVFIRSCAKQVVLHRYKAQGYKNGFCSGEVLQENDRFFVLYHAQENRFYVIEQDAFVCGRILALDEKHPCSDQEVRKTIALYLLEEKEEQLLQLIIEKELIGRHMKKRLERYQMKKYGVEKKEKE